MSFEDTKTRLKDGEKIEFKWMANAVCIGKRIVFVSPDRTTMLTIKGTTLHQREFEVPVTKIWITRRAAAFLDAT